MGSSSLQPGTNARPACLGVTCCWWREQAPQASLLLVRPLPVVLVQALDAQHADELGCGSDRLAMEFDGDDLTTIAQVGTWQLELGSWRLGVGWLAGQKGSGGGGLPGTIGQVG